jgi:thymidine kinase
MFLERKNTRQEKNGWIEVITGSMFSGKTEELIRRLKRAEIAGQNLKIFKPAIDNRYSDTKVVSHDDKTLHSLVVNKATDILAHINDEVEVVGIDEAQFFDDEIINVANDLANMGIRVIIAGLDMDYKGNPFGPMPKLMAIAEFVTKVHAICTRCGNLANYSHRIATSNDLVLLGSKNEYEPLCRKCFNELNKSE